MKVSLTSRALAIVYMDRGIGEILTLAVTSAAGGFVWRWLGPPREGRGGGASMLGLVMRMETSIGSTDQSLNVDSQIPPMGIIRSTTLRNSYPNRSNQAIHDQRRLRDAILLQPLRFVK